jgi:hypothetical protein
MRSERQAMFSSTWPDETVAPTWAFTFATTPSL